MHTHKQQQDGNHFHSLLIWVKFERGVRSKAANHYLLIHSPSNEEKMTKETHLELGSGFIPTPL